MRKNKNETTESWAVRVEMFEKGRALQRIANGDDPATVMEDMSRRIIDKMLYPILNSIDNKNPTSKYDAEKSRNRYDEIMKNVAKAPDHIDSDS